MHDSRQSPNGIDTTTPSAARLYDYYLGGKDNYAVDRAAAQQLFEQVPELTSMARSNRGFLRRAVKFLAQNGVTQFIDIGSGLPTQDPVHEVAQRHAPGSRVVYVDNDPIVQVHAEALLADDPSTTKVVPADLREPEAILDHPDVRGFLDFDKPVAVLMIAVLHFLRDEDGPYDLLQQYRDRLSPGSYIAITHVEKDTHPERAAFLEQVYAATSAPGQTRSHGEVARFFDGMTLVEPGLVHGSDWRPEETETYYPADQAWG